MRRYPVGRRALIRAALILLTLATSPAWAEPLGVYAWDDRPEGGLSGLVLSADGQMFWAVSDRGHLLNGQITRQDGQVTGLRVDGVVRLRNRAGRVPAESAGRDSEGLVRRSSGDLIVSYEGNHRIVIHSPDGQFRARVPTPPGARRLHPNGSFEGLAMDHRGWLYTLAERGEDGPAPLHRFTGTSWDRDLTFPRSGGYEPVGLDIGPDGHLYVLERQLGLRGFHTRLRRFALSEQALGAPETLLAFLSGHRVNYEGLSLWTHPNGDLIATLISDDNRVFAFRTLVAEFALPPA